MAGQLEGIVIALPTPLGEHEEIDEVSLCRLVDHAVVNGADGMMVAGTMGEGVALVEREKRRLIETVSLHNAGRVPLLATVSETSTKRAVEFVKTIGDCAVDYLVCTAPYFNRFPEPKSLLSHVRTISESTDKPVVFYNAPLATGNPVDVDTLEQILNMDNIVGIKDSSTDLRAFTELLRRYPKGNRPGSIMQGDEGVFDVSMMLGADGVVSGGGVIFIPLLKALVAAATTGEAKKATLLQQELTRELTALLGNYAGRDWVFHIKKRLVEKGIFTSPMVSAPFFQNTVVQA